MPEGLDLTWRHRAGIAADLVVAVELVGSGLF
jgi:hypothetical protein